VQRSIRQFQAGWRELAGAGSLLGCVALLVIYLVLRHSVPFPVAAKAVAALYVLNFVPGYVAWRFAFRVKAASAFETMVASLILGLLIAPLTWHTLCLLGLGAAFFPAMYAVAALLPFAYGWHRRPLAKLRALVPNADAGILWVTLSLVLLWSCQNLLADVKHDRVNILPYEDHTLHATFVAELSRSVPTEAIPSLAGARKWAYHNMPDVWAEMMRRGTGADPNDAYFYLALPLGYVFLSLGFYLALMRRFGRAGAVAGIVFAFGAVWFAWGHSLFSNWLTWYVHASYPASFGLAGVCLILYCATLIGTQNPRAPLLLASIVSVLLLWYKANFALPVAPAVAILYTAVLLKRKDYRWLAVCATAQLLLVLVRWLDLSTADVSLTFLVDPAVFLGWWWNHLGLPESLTNLREVAESLPALLKWPVIYTLCVVFTFHVGLLAIVYLIGRRRDAKTWGESDGADSLTLLILGCCAFGYILFPAQKGFVFNVSAHIHFLVHALLLTVLGAVVWRLACHAVRSGRVGAGVTVVLAVIAVVCNGAALRETALACPRPSDVISRAFYEACRFVEANTPPEATILVPDYRAPSVAGVLTQRRVVLERSGMWGLFRDITPIELDVQTFFGQPDPAEARSILNRYNVDYVVAKLAEVPSAMDVVGLTEVFQVGDAAVYRVERHVKLTSGDW